MISIFTFFTNQTYQHTFWTQIQMVAWQRDVFHHQSFATISRVWKIQDRESIFHCNPWYIHLIEHMSAIKEFPNEQLYECCTEFYSFHNYSLWKKRVHLLAIYLFTYIFRNNISVKNGIFLHDSCIDWYYRIHSTKDKEILWKYYNAIALGGFFPKTLKPKNL